MKNMLFLAALLLNLSIVRAQNWREDRPVAAFTGISVATGIHLMLTQGNDERLSLEASGFEKDEVLSTVRNGVLLLSIDHRNVRTSGRGRYVKAYLTFRQLSSLEASSGADVAAQGRLSFSNLNLAASSGCNLKLDLKSEELRLDVSSGADATLRGSARTLLARISSGAELDARQFTTDFCTAHASGGANASVYATRELRLQANGGADLSYSGPASVVSQQKSGGADISRQ